MRIYSKTLLSWPLVIHISQATRLYPGRWQNYYFYRVKMREPTLILQTYSPLELLQENSPFYCYDHYNRDKCLEKLGNELTMTHIENSSPTFTENYTYVPKPLITDDILVIRSDTTFGFPSMYSPRLFMTPEPALV